MMPFVNLCLFFREFCPGNPEWKRANEAKIVATLLKNLAKYCAHLYNNTLAHSTVTNEVGLP